jgi:hypothetical protein
LLSHTFTGVHAAAESDGENVAWATQGSHTRSVVGVPAVRRPWPIGHVFHAVQRMFAAVALKRPAGQAVHTRSLLAVAIAEMARPAAQGLLMGSHASSSLVDENVDPTTHAVHSRSMTSEPVCKWPEPAGHVFHALHAVLPAFALKCSAAHGAHVRSAETVACSTTSRPGPQSGLTGRHSSSLFVGEYVELTEHRAHCRSTAFVPSCERPFPMPHVFHPAQFVLPAVALNWPLTHTVHARSDVAVAEALMKCPMAHGSEIGVHTRSLCDVCAVLWYCVV